MIEQRVVAALVPAIVPVPLDRVAPLVLVHGSFAALLLSRGSRLYPDFEEELFVLALSFFFPLGQLIVQGRHSRQVVLASHRKGGLKFGLEGGELGVEEVLDLLKGALEGKLLGCEGQRPMLMVLRNARVEGLVLQEESLNEALLEIPLYLPLPLLHVAPYLVIALGHALSEPLAQPFLLAQHPLLALSESLPHGLPLFLHLLLKHHLDLFAYRPQPPPACLYDRMQVLAPAQVPHFLDRYNNCLIDSRALPSGFSLLQNPCVRYLLDDPPLEDLAVVHTAQLRVHIL